MNLKIHDISNELNNTTGGSGENVLNTNETYYNLKCIVRMTEFIPILGGNIKELNKIPELFLNKRSLLVLKNNDNKCFLYCYIRKFLNPIKKIVLELLKRIKK